MCSVRLSLAFVAVMVDLSVVPTIQPSLGLSAGHMRRNLSRKNKRRPPSIRVVIPEDQDLFRIPETRARSNSTGDADDNTKPPVKQAAETTTKGLQRAKTLVCSSCQWMYLYLW